MRLRPFWRFFGGKWRATSQGAYPQPLYRTIVEPFAGAAGYSLNHHEHDVILVERDPVIAAVWRYLITASYHDVAEIPPVTDVASLPDWVPEGARYLVGFWMNNACTAPRTSLSTWSRGRKQAARGRRVEGWCSDTAERIASQVGQIKHWRIIEGDFTEAPDIEATWFVDPTYIKAGKNYRHHLKPERFPELADWCRSRKGHPIVCEQEGADWLPFRALGTFKSGPRTTYAREAVWP